MVAAPRGRRRLRRKVSPATSSTPGSARAARKLSSAAPSNGSRSGSRRLSAPSGVPRAGSRPRRSPAGLRAKTRRTVASNERRLEKPAAKATSVTGSDVDASSTRAVWARRDRASTCGPAPTRSTRTRCSRRSLKPSRAASPRTPSRSTRPSPIRRIARATASERPSQAGDPGTASGRQRRQARKPASCAAAAVG